MKDTVGYKLGKAFGLMEKRMEECGYKYDRVNLIQNMHYSSRRSMEKMITTFHLSGACNHEAESEIAKLFEGIGEFPRTLSDIEYGYFWFGYYSNYSRVK